MEGWRAHGPGEPGAQRGCPGRAGETLASFSFPAFSSAPPGAAWSCAGDTDAERKPAQGKLDAR